ncbi:MAG TPA: hypothetical protein VGO28_03060 [Acidimicrobiia bacterium]|jgi:hypothetical protein
MERNDPEAPEADAIEQDQDAFPEADDDEVEPARVSDDPEAPEADAFEQAQEVAGEDEERE